MKFLRYIAAALLLVSSAAQAQIANPGVQGPASAVSGHIATYNGTTGKLIQDGGAVPTGTVTSVTCNGVAITTSGTCSTIGQIPGTATNDNASSGNVGQYPTPGTNASPGTSLTSSTVTNLTSLASLPAGDWDVSGVVCFTGNAATVTTRLQGAVSILNNSIGTIGTTGTVAQAFPSGTLLITNGDECLNINAARFSLASPTTVYLNAVAIFSANTLSAYGQVWARRVR